MRKTSIFLSICLIYPLLFALVTFNLTDTAHADVGSVDMTTQHNDNQRTGANLKETVLNTSNVNQASFGKLFSKQVDGHIYAQPLYLSAINIGGKVRNVVFVATMHNTIYCFDADDSTLGPLWSKTLDPSVALPDTNIGPSDWTGTISYYADIKTEIGILSTPVISRANNVIYLVDMTADPSNRNNHSLNTYKHKLYALDLTDGSLKYGGPKSISATVAGTGEGGTTVSLNSEVQLQRTALTLANGRIYFGFGSIADNGLYHGWVLGYNMTTLGQEVAYTTSPNGAWGGVWQSGQGLTVDSAGNLYFFSGNLSAATSNTDSNNKGDSVIKISPDSPTKLLDWFTPYNFVSLDDNDLDLGSSGGMIIPGTKLIVGGSKEGKLYLLNTDNLGKFHAGDDSQIVQSFKAAAQNIHGSPIYWDGPAGKQIYVWGEGDKLKAYNFNGTKISPAAPNSQSAETLITGYMPGGFLTVSADGNKAGSGIVWASTPLNQDANQAVVEGILRAYDASDLSHLLWDSKQNDARDHIGNFAKFVPPTVANGKVYMSTFSGQLIVYGLLSGTSTPTPTPITGGGTNLALGKAVTVSSTEAGANIAANVVDGNLGTRWSSAWSTPQWIYVDLGAAQNVNRVVLNWEASYGTSYKIQTSNDAINWTDQFSTTAGDGGTDDISFTPTAARYVRMSGTAKINQYGFSLWEFQVYGGVAITPTPTAAPTATPTSIPTSNLALGKAVSASGQCAASEAYSYATDGSASTKWCDNVTVGDKWVKLDLVNSQTINRWVVKHAGAGGEQTGFNTVAFKLQMSSDGIAFTDVDSVTGNTANVTDRAIPSTSSRYWRVLVSNGGGDNKARIYEVELYGAGGTTSSSTPTPTPTPTPIPTATPTPTPIPGGGTNLALGKAVTVSSTETGSNIAAYVVDGNLGTRWSSAWSVPQWIYIDLGTAQNVNRVVLNWEVSYGTSYKIQTSNDALNWVDNFTTTTGDGGTDDISFTPTSVRYVRLSGTAKINQYGFSLWEFQIYGGAAVPPTPTAAPTATPTPTPTPIPTSNLALGKAVSASGQCAASEAYSYATDGLASTKWCDNVTVGDKWVKLDLINSQTINRWVVKHAGAGGEQTGFNTVAFKLQMSSDGITFTDVDSVTGNTANLTDRAIPSTSSRYWRVLVSNGGGDNKARIYEVELYGMSGGIQTLAQNYN